jgi:hypothetical protein
MSEVVNVLVAFAVIIFLFRWITNAGEWQLALPSRSTLTTGLPFRSFHPVSFLAGYDESAGSDSGTDEQRRAANMLGFRPKRVTPDMVRSSLFRLDAG